MSFAGLHGDGHQNQMPCLCIAAEGWLFQDVVEIRIAGDINAGLQDHGKQHALIGADIGQGVDALEDGHVAVLPVSCDIGGKFQVIGLCIAFKGNEGIVQDLPGMSVFPGRELGGAELDCGVMHVIPVVRPVAVGTRLSSVVLFQPVVMSAMPVRKC
ncbi:MAG: hypothetical protein ACKO1H_16090 [Tabrizicola sp.]